MGFEDTEPEEDNVFVKKVYAICEGAKTEPNYLEFFIKAHQDDGSLEYVNIEKISFDDNNSNRKDMMRLLDGEMVMLSTGKYTPFFFITKILREYSKLIGLDERLEKTFGERKNALFKQFENNANEMGILMGGYIDDVPWFMDRAKELIEAQDSLIDHGELEGKLNRLRFGKRQLSNVVFGKIIECYEELYDADDMCDRLRGIRSDIINNIPEIKKMDDEREIVTDKKALLDIIIGKIEKDQDYRPEYRPSLTNGDLCQDKEKTKTEKDRRFIVFDRDYDNNDFTMKKYERTDDDYNEIIDYCSDERRNYEVLLSTPFFEFWLLMHHKDADYRGIKRSTRTMIEEQIKTKEGIASNDRRALKNISPTRFNNYYKDYFEYALEQSMHFETDPKKLITEIGTNVGIKLKSLLSD